MVPPARTLSLRDRRPTRWWGPGRASLREGDPEPGPHLDLDSVLGRGLVTRRPGGADGGLVQADLLHNSLEQLRVLDVTLFVDEDGNDHRARDLQTPGEGRILRFGDADKLRRRHAGTRFDEVSRLDAGSLGRRLGSLRSGRRAAGRGRNDGGGRLLGLRRRRFRPLLSGRGLGRLRRRGGGRRGRRSGGRRDGGRLAVLGQRELLLQPLLLVLELLAQLALPLGELLADDAADVDLGAGRRWGSGGGFRAGGACRGRSGDGLSKGRKACGG